VKRNAACCIGNALDTEPDLGEGDNTDEELIERL
jgi:hypothetical protein